MGTCGSNGQYRRRRTVGALPYFLSQLSGKQRCEHRPAARRRRYAPFDPHGVHGMTTTKGFRASARPPPQPRTPMIARHCRRISTKDRALWVQPASNISVTSESAIPESTPHLTGYEPSGPLYENGRRLISEPCDRLLLSLPTGRFLLKRLPGREASSACIGAPPARDGGPGRHRRGGTVIPIPPSADSYAAAAEAAAAAAMRLISAHIRVLGEACMHLWFPAPDAPVGFDTVSDADPAVWATTASRA